MAEKIKQEIATGEFDDATDTWSQLERVIADNSNDVVSVLLYNSSLYNVCELPLNETNRMQDFYNFLLDAEQDPVSTTTTSMNRYARYLSSKASTTDGGIDSLMNGVIREKLGIIPKNVR